jgi:hypothetical protein
VKPVQEVLGLRSEVEGQVADVLATVSEKRDLLVSLHARGSEDLEQPAFGFLVIGLDIAKAPGRPLAGDDLPGDHLKPAIAGLFAVSSGLLSVRTCRRGLDW